jgi:hypothetical protein
MKTSVVIAAIVIFSSNIFLLANENDNSKKMNQYIDLKKIKIEKNSDLFKITTLNNEQVLILKNNLYNQKIDSLTGKEIDSVYGKVILLGGVKKDYKMVVDMKFLGTHIDMKGAGWFGFTVRAQDCDNYELVWFMPGGAEETNTVAYLPVAHGIIPWWTEAYSNQKKGNIQIPQKDWFTARIDVKGDEFTVYLNDQLVFNKKLTYYLKSGRPGLFVGTATDVAFRRIRIEDINDS